MYQSFQLVLQFPCIGYLFVQKLLLDVVPHIVGSRSLDKNQKNIISLVSFEGFA
ncbi:hypothetical protein Scep_026953 [Stephania cephalantha]|uniref:Uncharacterized protein n=1 Tax=Stephania cephalantha TaxID=152367 RepID=A0AAP0EV18_9MAGN